MRDFLQKRKNAFLVLRVRERVGLWYAVGVVMRRALACVWSEKAGVGVGPLGCRAGVWCGGRRVRHVSSQLRVIDKSVTQKMSRVRWTDQSWLVEKMKGIYDTSSR